MSHHGVARSEQSLRQRHADQSDADQANGVAWRSHCLARGTALTVGLVTSGAKAVRDLMGMTTPQS